ncbi:MAG: hypothetical protein QMC98_00380 [Candidatus Thermoplasmatota archaeon]|nr:hypothetical protein [Candidatus Thermoplasmatota archaeon]
MQQLLVPERPSVYVPEKELIVVHTYPEEFISKSLDELVRETKELKVVTKKVLSKLLKLLTTRAISFTLEDLKVEQDPEIPAWQYVLVRIKLGMEKKSLTKISDALINHAYSETPPKDSVKVLVVLEHV